MLCKKAVCVTVLLALVLLGTTTTTTLCHAATTQVISGSFTVSKGDSKYNDFTYDITGMSKATGTAIVSIADAEVTGGGLKFAGYSGAPNALVPALNLSLANTNVKDSTITLQGYLPRYSQIFFSNTHATMTGTTTLFVFTDIVPQYYVIINIVDVEATWPVSGDGGNMFQIGHTVPMIPYMYSAVYVTRANVSNAANVWNVVVPLQNPIYFVNVLDYSMIALDYVNCYNCKKAFIYSSTVASPPIVGSENSVVRYSNCTQTGGKPFYAALSDTTMSFGPNNGSIIFSGITTDGPLFQFPNGARGQVKRYTMLSIMHIRAASSGIASGIKFPLYLQEGFPNMPSSHVYMGNITFGGKLLSSSADYEAAFLYPKYMVTDYSYFVGFGVAHSISYSTGDYNYKAGDPTLTYCHLNGYTGVGIETLGSTANGGKTWTRPECLCKSGRWMPYCTPVYDPLLYYAGYTFGLVDCVVDNCTKCWWGHPDRCTECVPGFMLYPDTWSCVPNICGECPDDGKIYTYTEGICVENKVSNCATVNVKGTCTACNESYTLYQGQCVLCNVENCAICSSTNFCYRCNSDQMYSVDSSTGKCVYCGDTCSQCTSSGCKACNDGYTLSATTGECTPLCKLNGCTTCASATTCRTCDTGLTLTLSGTCSCNIANCDTCYGTRCKECAYGYFYNVKANTCDPVASYVAPTIKDASEMTRVTLTTIALLAVLFFMLV